MAVRPLCLSTRALLSLPLGIASAFGGRIHREPAGLPAAFPTARRFRQTRSSAQAEPIPSQGGDILATRGRPTQQKRQKERARQEQRKMKEVRRQEAKERRVSAPPPPHGVDPDLEGIVAGPQPLTEWQQEGLAAFEEVAEEDPAEEASS